MYMKKGNHTRPPWIQKTWYFPPTRILHIPWDKSDVKTTIPLESVSYRL